jgi:hypothetical protein
LAFSSLTSLRWPISASLGYIGTFLLGRTECLFERQPKPIKRVLHQTCAGVRAVLGLQPGTVLLNRCIHVSAA